MGFLSFNGQNTSASVAFLLRKARNERSSVGWTMPETLALRLPPDLAVWQRLLEGFQPCVRNSRFAQDEGGEVFKFGEFL